MHSKYSMTKSFPHIIKGELFKDNRGKLFSCNKFDMTSIKRMYSIENFDIVVRLNDGKVELIK